MPSKLGGGNDLGSALSLLRRVKGWDQRKVASVSGVRLQSIKAIEQGLRRASPKTLGPILAGLGFSFETLTEVRALLRRLHDEASSVLPGDEEASPVSLGPISIGAADLRRELLAALALAAPVTRRPVEKPVTAHECSRDEAQSLWERFHACTGAGQLDLAREASEFHTAGFAELLCDKSRGAAGDSAGLVLHLARCATAVAAAAPGNEGWRSRLMGYAGTHLANALRVGGDLKQADEAFGRSKTLWDAGVADDPGLLNAARVLHLEASLRREQRRVREALALIDEALLLDRWGESPTLLMGRARALEELGLHEAAVAQLLRLDSQLGTGSDLRSRFVVRGQLVSNLCHQGHHAEAEAAFASLRALARKLGRLDLLRVEWLRGRVAAGLGRSDEAIAALGSVRDAFMAQGNAYDAALATLELAEVHAALHHAAEVKALALACASTFHDQGVHREARSALELFKRAAEEERVSTELVRHLVTYLYRSRHDESAHFLT